MHRIGRTGRARRGAGLHLVREPGDRTRCATSEAHQARDPEMEIATFDEQEALADRATPHARPRAHRPRDSPGRARDVAKREREERARGPRRRRAQDANGRGGQGGRNARRKPAGVAGAQPDRQRPAQKGPKKPAAGSYGEARRTSRRRSPRRGSPRRGPLAAHNRSSRRQRIVGGEAHARGSADLRPGYRAHHAPTWQAPREAALGVGGCGDHRPEARRLSSNRPQQHEGCTLVSRPG